MGLAEPLFRDNIKVHFAGAEQFAHARICQEAGVRYALFSVFNFICAAHAGKRDKIFIERWFEKLVEFVRSNELKSVVVEVDCQKVLGVDEAWRLREKMRDALPNNRQINVFHVDDGRKGLDRLIEFSDYIAISVPELRKVRSRSFQEDVYRLADYIKNSKPEIDVHLLGCTQQSLLKRCRFCTSADSTTYLSVTRYGKCLGSRMRNLKNR